MENNNVLLLAQLLAILKSNFENLDKAYSDKDKENFDRAKKAILEIQKKISYIITKS